MIENNEPRIGRRDFLRFSAKTGLVVLGSGVVGYGIGYAFGLIGGEDQAVYQRALATVQALNTSLQATVESQAAEIDYLIKNQNALRVRLGQAEAANHLATQTANEMRDYRILATADAYGRDPGSLKEIMDSLPESLRRDSVKIEIQYAKKVSDDRLAFSDIFQASGTVVSYDKTSNRIGILTADHLFDPMSEYTVHRVALSQPHTGGDTTLLFLTTDVRVYQYPPRDIAIIFADLHQERLRDDIGQERMDENWKPVIGEKLYSLSYPGITGRSIGYTPSVFTVTGADEVQQDVLGNSLIGGGSSGAAVTKADGSIIGIYVTLGESDSVIIPIQDSYRELLEQAS